MTTPLDKIAFFANSKNRVAVLTALTNTPRTRQDLLDELDASRVTLERVLRDLEARHWVERTDETYTATPLGRWVCDEITDILDVLETEHQIREVLPWFPTDTVDFDIPWLHNAEIVCATKSNPMAPIRRAADKLRGGTHVRILTMQGITSFFDIVGEPLVQGEMELKAVATPGVYETIANDPQMAAAFQEVADTPDATFFVTKEIPLVVHIVDESVLIGLTDDQATPRAAIESTDETIYSWAVDFFNATAESAEPVALEVATA